MTWIGELWRQLRYRISGTRFDQDVAEEMRLHLELRAADQQADALAPDAARARLGPAALGRDDPGGGRVPYRAGECRGAGGGIVGLLPRLAGQGAGQRSAGGRGSDGRGGRGPVGRAGGRAAV